ncbi:MAG: thiaminase II [Vagococcus sp.]|uniref:thiaminase II n=1 Tax=Vagococcus sp. TaxID=1933889 RepID=UPI002FC77FBD
MFTKKARALTVPYWEGSFSHPFVRGLQEGTLGDKEFRHYLLQDRYYLEHFSKIHVLIAEKIEDKEVKEMLLLGAKHLAEGEIAIRESFFKELAITEKEIKETPIAATAYNYVSHMYRQLLDGSLNSAVAGLLPCAWLYQEIGTELIKTGSPNSLYQRWIETYSGEEAKDEVMFQCSLLNRLYDESNKEVQQQMLDVFVISSKMEYLFWGMSFTLENWPEGDLDATSKY